MTEAMKRGQQIHEEIEQYIREHAERAVTREVFSPPENVCLDNEILQALDEAK